VSGRVTWRAAAESDLSEAYLFIGTDSIEAAEGLLDAVGDAVAFLPENPFAGSPREFTSPEAVGIRSWVLRDFPNHLIFYRVGSEGIEIVRVLHGARDVQGEFGEES
jgi:toxin ParE1/3/4